MHNFFESRIFSEYVYYYYNNEIEMFVMGFYNIGLFIEFTDFDVFRI